MDRQNLISGHGRKLKLIKIMHYWVDVPGVHKSNFWFQFEASSF